MVTIVIAILLLVALGLMNDRQATHETRPAPPAPVVKTGPLGSCWTRLASR